MYCHSCGALNDDNAWRCTRCSTLLHHDDAPADPQSARAKRVPTHLAGAVLVTIFFLPSPVGLVAVYYALRARKHLAQGDPDRARAQSKRALIWCVIAIAVGIVLVAFTANRIFQYTNQMFRQLQPF